MPMSDYYIWLLDRVGLLQETYSTYSRLLRHLFVTDYIYVLKRDEDRAEGGKNLRVVFSNSENIYIDDVKSGNCSVLEMLIALAFHLEDNSRLNHTIWFIEMINNLGLGEFSDTFYDANAVDAILNKWMNRLYDHDGQGNIFKITDFHGDMRTMTTWDQMNAYLVDKYYSEK